jgi:hypothetical protein
LVEREPRSGSFTTRSAQWGTEATPEKLSCTRLVVTDLERSKPLPHRRMTGWPTPVKLRGDAGAELIENLSGTIWDQNETIRLNRNGKREEGAAGSFTLSEADERPDVVIRNEAYFKPIR